MTVALFAVALAGCGLLTTVGVIVAMDTFGPVSDNAQGIAEMSGDVDEEGAQILTELDAVGNTTKAVTKGIAIATAVLAATALFGSYRDAITTALRGADVSQLTAFNYQVFSPNTLVGVIVAMDTFGPVADNAQGIAEMSGDVEGPGVDILTELDAVGNTTKAITKGIAIATAVLAATALFGSYRDAINTLSLIHI